MSAALLAPVAVMADDHHSERRYYDRDGRDYHYWNADEDQHYRAYLVEQHRVYVPFVRVNGSRPDRVSADREAVRIQRP